MITSWKEVGFVQDPCAMEEVHMVQDGRGELNLGPSKQFADFASLNISINIADEIT